MSKQQILISITAVMVVIGLVFSWITFRQTPDLIRKIKRRQADIVTLQKLHQQWMYRYKTIDMYQALPTHAPKPLTELVNKSFANVSAEIRARPTQAILDGWNDEITDIAFQEISLIELDVFLKICMNQRPPWLLKECTIRASDQHPGNGKVTLVMEALTKKDGI